MTKDFMQKLTAAWAETGSMVCVGLDPQMDRLPQHLRTEDYPFFAFNRAIIDATRKHCCAYKPQFAHYAAENRLQELSMTMAYLRETVPGHIHILDAKRNDIGTTAEFYAEEAFKVYGADAVTLNPYLGGDSLRPFTRSRRHGVFVLCKTSNPGSGELQDLELKDGQPLFTHVARQAAADWNFNGNVGLVVGATYPEQLQTVRTCAPGLPFLVPGIGAQGGDLEAVIRAGLNADGNGLLINSSRAILYASDGENFAAAAAAAAAELDQSCRRIRNACLNHTATRS
jgi:orotidine-5'-phosphate decarboxylase